MVLDAGRDGRGTGGAVSYSRWREQFFQEAGRLGITWEDASRLLRAASTMQRVSEISCSIDVGERELARLEKRADAAEKRSRKIVESYGLKLTSQGDPRGCPMAVVSEGREYGIPGRGLPARCFA